MNKFALLLTCAFVTFQTHASVAPASASLVEAAPKGHIERLIAYSRVGNGDVYLSMEANGEICSSGYFIDKSSAGYNGILSMLMAAYQANLPIVVVGYKDTHWSGSPNAVCELYNVTYQ